MAAPYKYNAETFKQKFEEYKIWLEGEKFYRPELIKSGDRAGDVINVEIQSPPDRLSFCLFLGIDHQTFYNYCSEEMKENNQSLFDIATYVSDWIKSKQLRGAISNQYNSAIVARITGLSDNINIDAKVSQQTINIAIDGEKLNLTE